MKSATTTALLPWLLNWTARPAYSGEVVGSAVGAVGSGYVAFGGSSVSEVPSTVLSLSPDAEKLLEKEIDAEVDAEAEAEAEAGAEADARVELYILAV
jgi:hypothetical protein